MNKLEIINQAIREGGFKSYLEIGLGDLKNFKGVVCEEKQGTDPAVKTDTPGCYQMASDEFFGNSEGEKFDVIFIDGLHHAEQVEKDIVNSWNSLNPGGIILIHDIKPHNELMSLVPRQTKQWTGDVFRAWYGFVKEYGEKIQTHFVTEEYGIGLIQKSRHKVKPGFTSDITFSEYKEQYLDKQ